MQTANERPSMLKISYLTTVLWPNDNRVSYNCVLTSSYCILKQFHVVRSADREWTSTIIIILLL